MGTIVTDLPLDPGAEAAQQALRDLSRNGTDQNALDTLADSDVLLPDPGADLAGPVSPNGSGEILSLPVYEQEDGARLVPVFTSQARMTQALPQIQHYRRVPLSLLADSWPSEELSLSIDVGAPEEVALTAQGVKALLGHGAG